MIKQVLGGESFLNRVLCRYRMDAEDFAVAERNLRSWICRTILRPLITKIDEINVLFMKVCFFQFQEFYSISLSNLSELIITV